MMFRSYNTTAEYLLSDYVDIHVAKAISRLDIFTRQNIVFLHVKIYGFSQWQKST